MKGIYSFVEEGLKCSPPDNRGGRDERRRRVASGRRIKQRPGADFLKCCSVSSLSSSPPQPPRLFHHGAAVRGRLRSEKNSPHVGDATSVIISGPPVACVQSLGEGTVTQNLQKKPKKKKKTHMLRGQDASILRRALVECCESVRRTRG